MCIHRASGEGSLPKPHRWLPRRTRAAAPYGQRLHGRSGERGSPVRRRSRLSAQPMIRRGGRPNMLCSCVLPLPGCSPWCTLSKGGTLTSLTMSGFRSFTIFRNKKVFRRHGSVMTVSKHLSHSIECIFRGLHWTAPPGRALSALFAVFFLRLPVAAPA